LTAQAAARMMVEAGGGRIIQIGSISGQRGNMGGAAYGASKAASMHICKVLATELSGQGVMVNAIAPGPIETGLSHHGPTRKKAYTDRIPVGAYGTVDAVANAALFFASDECVWTTGTIHNVDGGYGAQGASYDPQEIGG
ncbi:MAG: SDR family oxidoreductase, partial [Rhodospirillaceae bacterium]|nr:SDR family oxidoreductase [Rhodospirillaceae bacterium]